MAARGYPAEFGRRVIDLVEAGRPVAAVAAELGISGQLVYTWQR
jgi:transposase-like protein